MYSINLLSDKNVVEVPFVKVDIGEYTFGIYQRNRISSGGVRITYPNYINGLTINKINGTVNTYTLNMTYPITANDDPNFMEKVFSSVSDTRKIVFSYGDFATPTYIYGNEEALITDVTSSIDVVSSKIDYEVKAVSSAAVTLSGNYTFPKRYAKPSTVIREILRQPKYNLLKVYTGMQDMNKVESAGLIASDDQVVQLETQLNCSPTDYLNYLVSCMVPAGTSSSGTTKSTLYTLVIDSDRDGKFGGPYFRVQKLQRNSNSLESVSAYTIDVGYPGADIVMGFSIKDRQGYSILYDYNNSINSYNYGKRIDDNGNISYVYAPPLTSSKQLHLLTEADRNWWTKVTEFPIQVDLTIKGLLKPAILMNYIKLNVWFYGRKHISSGYYIITAQSDSITKSGFRTTLSLTRVAPDGDIDVAVGLFGEKINDNQGADGSSVRGSVSAGSTGALNGKSNMTNTKLGKLPTAYVHTGNVANGNYIKIGYDDKKIDISGSLTPKADKIVGNDTW